MSGWPTVSTVPGSRSWRASKPPADAGYLLVDLTVTATLSAGRSRVWISHHMPTPNRPATLPFTTADSAEYAPTHGVSNTSRKAQMKLPRKARTGVALRQAFTNTIPVSANMSIGNMSVPNVITAAV